jgi:multidrug resistance efflux pump
VTGARAVAVVLATAVAGSGCREEAPRAVVPVVEVKQQKFARVIDADGYLRPVKATPVTVPADVQWPLRITWMAVDGVTVKQGDTVARFDDLELKERLANARSDRQVAAARKQKEALLLRTAEEERLRSTEGAKRELTMTRTFARRDPAIFARDQIIEGEIDEKLQEVKVEHASDAQQADRRLARTKLGVIDVEARKADEAIQRSERGLTALAIAAPHDGVFTVKRNWTGEPMRVGDTVWRSMSVAEVSLVENMEVEVFVLEAEAAGLAKGKQAEVVIESQPGRPLAATVKQVEAVAKRRLPKSPTQYFGVILALDRTDPATMKPGQRARARLHLHDQPGLVIPRPALLDREGIWTVHRREPDGSFKPVQVLLGPSTAGLVTITSGLRAGDLVALRDPGKAVDELVPTATGGARP